MDGITNGDITRWQKLVKMAECSSGFDRLVRRYNQDGLSVIDYLEAIDGEFYKIGSDIRGIYEALNTGVAIICLQKNAAQAYGQGGATTLEKARLYITLDTLSHKPGCSYVAAKLVKAKCYSGENPNGKERHFRVIRGAELVPVSDWIYCNAQQREAYAKRYEAMAETASPPPRAAAPRQAESVVAGVGATPGAVRAAFAAGKTCSGCSCRNRHGLCAITGVYQEPEAMACKHYIRGGGR